MKFYKYINTIPDKPIVGGEETEFNPGDTIMVRKGAQENYYWEQYKVAADGLVHFVRGITDDQWGRIERLTGGEISKVESITTEDITKLKEDYTKPQIDDIIGDVNERVNNISSGYQGTATLDTIFNEETPTGLYTPLESGDYGAVDVDGNPSPVDLTIGINTLEWDGSTLTVIKYPTNLTGVIYDSDIGTNINGEVLNIGSYIGVGLTLSNGTNNGAGDWRSIIDLPITSYIGKKINILGVQFLGNTGKYIVFRDNDNAVILSQTMTPDFSVVVPNGAAKVSLTIRSNPGESYENIQLIVSEVVPEELVDKLKGFNIMAKTLSDDNAVPEPTQSLNAANKKYVDETTIPISSLDSSNFYYDGVTVVNDKYLTSTGFPTDEVGAIHIEIPYTIGDVITYSGVTAVPGQDVTDVYLTARVYIREGDIRTGAVQYLGSQLSEQPFTLSSGISDMETLKFNIYRPLQEGKYNFEGLQIKNETTGQIYVKWSPKVRSLLGAEFEPSQDYKDYVEERFNNISVNDNNISLSPNYYVKRGTPTSQRNDASSMVKLNDGSLLMSWSHFGGSDADHAFSQIALAKSVDNGRTWSEPWLLPLDADRAQSTPSLNITNQGNVCMVLVSRRGTEESPLDAHISYRISTDNGLNWSVAEPLTEVHAGYVITTGDRTFRRSNGVLYHPYYTLLSGNGNSTTSVYEGNILRSTNGGVTWEVMDVHITDEVPNYSVMEPGMTETADGKLLYYYRTTKGQCRGKLSSDNGVTWGTSFDLFKASNSTSYIQKLVGMDAKMRNIWLAVHNDYIGNFNSAEGRRYMKISISIDGINYVTTNTYVYYNNGTIISFEPSIFENVSNGEIIITWSTDVGYIDLVANIISYDAILRLINIYNL